MAAAVDYGYEQDLGYGDAEPDYGYGDENAQQDYGYGDAAPTDYGYGDAAPTDYGYGDAEPAAAPPAETKRPKRRCSVTRYSLVTPENGALNAASVIQDFRKGANAETLNENGDIARNGGGGTIAEAAAESAAPAPEEKKKSGGLGKLFGRK